MTIHHFIDPWLFTKEESKLVKKLDKTFFPRLASSVDEIKSLITFEITGTINDCNQASIHGQANVDVTLTCQYCLQPFLYQNQTQFTWLLVYNESEIEERDQNSDEQTSTLLVENQKLDLLKEVEDELLLSLPLISRHGDEDTCTARQFINNQIPEEKTNPFSNLAELLKKES